MVFVSGNNCREANLAASQLRFFKKFYDIVTRHAGRNSLETQKSTTRVREGTADCYFTINL